MSTGACWGINLSTPKRTPKVTLNKLICLTRLVSFLPWFVINSGWTFRQKEARKAALKRQKAEEKRKRSERKRRLKEREIDRALERGTCWTYRFLYIFNFIGVYKRPWSPRNSVTFSSNNWLFVGRTDIYIYHSAYLYPRLNSAELFKIPTELRFCQ